ncbi:MAG TPA: hypothetical protein VFB59_03175 [Candidatus Saccharimonadales bacterium]|nr:hypothetical protein [Candidatus Saccharimonadales bacterium]
METILNVVGITGVGLLLFGFYRVNSGRWGNKSFWYEFDNLLGAVCIIVYQLYYHAYVTVVANAIWGGIALWGLLMFFRRLHHRSRKAH